jgi:EmrB/QacA subfamily drug resistance transporter
MTTAMSTGTSPTHREILTIFSGLMLGMLLAAIDQTIVSTALPTIVGDLGGLDHLSWVVTAYLLTSTASTPLYGKLGDLYGRKRLFQAAIVVFLAGSLLAGASQNMAQLIGFRAVQGLGAGGLMSLAMAIIGDIVAPRQRGRYTGYMGGVFALASVGGPLVGGFFVDKLSWRWVFYINLPIGIVALAVVGVVLRVPAVRREHSIDYLGSALLVGAVTTTLLVTVWGGNEYAWTSPTIVALGTGAIMLAFAFVAQERRAIEPVLPLRIFRSPVVVVTTILAFLIGMAMFGALVFMPVYLQVVRGSSPTTSGLQLSPLMFGMIVTSVVSGRLITRLGRYRAFPVAGALFMTFGIFLLSRLEPDSAPWIASVFLVIMGVGLGLSMQVLTLAAQNAVEVRDLGIATSANTFFRSMGGALGVAIFGSVFSSRLASYLAERFPTFADSDRAVVDGGPEVIRSLPDAVRTPVIAAFADALQDVFLLAAPVGAAAFVVALFLKDLPLRDQAESHADLDVVAPDDTRAPEGAPDPTP